MLAELLNDLRGLHSKLSNRHKHKGLNLVQSGVDFLNKRNTVRSSLSRTVLGFCDDVLVVKDFGYSLLLNRRRKLEAHLENALFKTQVSKLCWQERI